jgi:hypothetical protein
MRLPLADRASISTGATITMVSGCWDNLPNKVRPAAVWDEKEIVEAIIDELRTNMAIDLEPHPTVDRWPPALVKPAGGRGPRRTLIVCSKSAQHALFKLLTPIFDVASHKICILMSPVPRYMQEGCCKSEEHMPNRRSRNFGRQLLNDLKEATNNMRDFVFTSTFKTMKILDPQVSWRGASTEELWGADLVHPSVAGYAKLAAGVEAICLSIESGAKKRARSNSFETGDGPSGLHNRQRMFGADSRSGQRRGHQRGDDTAARGGRGGRGRN